MNINFKNKYQEKLYNELMTLVTDPSIGGNEFVIKDVAIKGQSNLLYRIFTYSLPGFTQFKLPSAKDSRGTMFIVDKNTGKAELIALPMQKFFSVGEGEPHLAKLHSVDNAKRIYMKEDGSLMTSYVSPIDGELKLKSKNNAEYVNKSVIGKALPENLMKDLMKAYIQDAICVDLELTSPENRVLMEYKDYKLHVLSARSLLTGDKIDVRSDFFKQEYPHIHDALVKEVPRNEYDLNRSDIEGYVLEMENGELLKVKTLPYLSMVAVVNIQDMSKLSVNLYAAAVNEILDEVRSLFHYRNRSENFPIDKLIAQADAAEDYARKTYLPFVKHVNEFVEKYKHLDIKDYIIKAQQEDKDLMPVLMTLYKGKEFNLKDFAIKKFGKKALSNF